MVEKQRLLVLEVFSLLVKKPMMLALWLSRWALLMPIAFFSAAMPIPGSLYHCFNTYWRKQFNSIISKLPVTNAAIILGSQPEPPRCGAVNVSQFFGVVVSFRSSASPF
jgi:hypothetical protein